MDEEERAELIRRLFAVMTGKLEDAAADASEGQQGAAPIRFGGQRGFERRRRKSASSPRRPLYC